MERIKVPGRRCGMLHPKIDKRNLMFSKYAKALPPPPATIDWVTALKGNYGMLGNDTAGDCVEAAAYHEVQRWTSYAGKPFTPTTEEAISLYSTLTGYVPGNPNTDNGTDPEQMLKYWTKSGISGHKIVAWVTGNPANVTEVKQIIDLFGAGFMAWALPISAQSPVIGLNGNPAWNMELPGINGQDGVAGSWGGHMTDAGQYGTDAQGNSGIQIVTWGELYDVTWAFVAQYCEAIYAIVTEDWIEANGQSPSGFDINALLADQKLVTA